MTANSNHSRHRPNPLLVLAALLLMGGLVGLATVRETYALPKRFAAVVPGQLYRSGEVSAAQLARLKQRYGITRVICLLNPDEPVTQRERAAVAALGLAWRNIGLKGSGASTPQQRDELRDLLADPSAGPTLVHCAAGVNRTGLAVGMYRLHHQGWTVEDVLAEMRTFDFEDEPHHENLRQALQAEAALAGQATTRPATTQPAMIR